MTAGRMVQAALPGGSIPAWADLERLAAEAFRNTPNLVMVLDDDRRIGAVNPAGVALTGVSEADAVGQHLRRVLAEDSADTSLALIESAAAGRRGNVEVVFRSTSTGQPELAGDVPVELGVAPLVLEDRTCGLIISGRDIAERKRLEHELEELASSFRALAETSDLGIYRFSFEPEFRVEHTNQAFAEAIGYSRKQLATDASPLNDHLTPEVRQRFIDNRFGSEPEAWPIEFDWVRPDGVAVVLSVEEVPVRDRQGRVIASLGLCRDVTRERRREASIVRALGHERQAADGLRQVDELRRLFLQAVSHELRTPLTSVLGFASTLQTHGFSLGEDRVHELSGRMVVQAQRIERLLDDLLDVERLSRGVLALDHADHDLSELVVTTLEYMGEPEVECDTVPVTVSMDPGKIERVVVNLVANARRHAGPRARVSVHVAPDDHGATLIVEDDGPGIPDDLKRQVFEPFAQGPASRGHPSPGTGIGLTLVAEFVRLHGGEVEVTDTPGGGARFVVRLPRWPPSD